MYLAVDILCDIYIYLHFVKNAPNLVIFVSVWRVSTLRLSYIKMFSPQKLCVRGTDASEPMGDTPYIHVHLSE